jgi:hypothetical protein
MNADFYYYIDMKKLLLPLFLVLLGFNNQILLASEGVDSCKDGLASHLNEIDASEALLNSLKTHSKDISSYEITLMQKSMSQRYASLKRFQELSKNCTPKVLGDAVSIYDFTLVGKSVFSDTVLRRVFMGLDGYKEYNLKDFEKDYKAYTSNSFIESTLAEIEQSHTELPTGIKLETSKLDYDPNLYKLSDTAINATTSVVAGFARIWGFVSDHTKWRQGHIKNNAEAVKSIKDKIKPLDLIYETRKFTLSNLTIPGAFGHVGVWLGTKEELIALGIWDQEYFAPYREHVEAGRSIMELRKKGIQFQSIETFINLDEIAVTRIKNITDRANEVYAALSEQDGKKYDFKFDARSAEKITCAELITYSFGDIKWPQTKTLFQLSIRPDDIALKTLDESDPAEFILYYKGIKKKDGGGFEVKNFDDFKKALGWKSPEDLAKEKALKEKRERENKERREYEEMYGRH